jgi:hypothetical protein
MTFVDEEGSRPSTYRDKYIRDIETSIQNNIEHTYMRIYLQNPNIGEPTSPDEKERKAKIKEES